MGTSRGFAVRDDGSVWGWGDNRFGGLGNGIACDWDVTGPGCSSSVPVRVSNLFDAVDVVDMYNAGAALDADGRVWVWGSNTSGEFGDGTVGFSDEYAVVPQLVPGLEGVSTLEEGYFGARVIVPGPAA
jgi:alpha-tubulin suppressor-like RCC1 family protein